MLFAVAFVFVVAYAMASDARDLVIPNWTSLALIGLFFGHALLADRAIPIASHVAVAAAAFAGGYLLYMRGWVAGGDVKLLTAMALWAGPAAFPEMLFVVSLAGLALALAIRTYQRFDFLIEASAIGARTRRFVPRWARHGLCPYGLAIGAGALYSLPALFA